MKKNMKTIIITSLSTIVAMGLVIRGEDLYVLAGFGLEWQQQTYHGRAMANLLEPSAEGAIVEVMVNRDSKPSYTWADGQDEITKNIQGMKQEDTRKMRDRPMDIIHMPYGAYKKLDVESNTKDGVIYFVISSKEEKCDGRDYELSLQQSIKFSYVENLVSEIRATTAKKRYDEKSPCKRWGRSIIELKSALMTGQKLSLNLPYGDKTLEDKTIFAFVNRGYYDSNLKRTLKK